MYELLIRKQGPVTKDSRDGIRRAEKKDTLERLQDEAEYD
jgi:hypothetical protein